jgi:hypothetical protein
LTIIVHVIVVTEKNILESASLGDDGIEKKNALGV